MTYPKSTLILLLLLIISGCSSGAFNPTRKGQDSPQQIVDLYLSALQSGDEQLLVSLIMPGYDAESAIQNKIQHYGNTKLTDVQIEYLPTESSYFVTANLRAKSTDETDTTTDITDQLHLQKQDEEWFIILGTPTNAPSPAPTPATSS